MAYFVYVVVPCFLAYAIQQTRMIVRLVHLLRHPGSIAQFGLAARFLSGLCYGPVLMMLFLLGPEIGPSDDANLLELMIFAPWGAAFALCFWVAMTIWFRSIIKRDLAIYREPTALVPVTVLALVCLNYVIGIAWVFARAAISNGSPMINGPVNEILLALVMALLVLCVPAAPLAGFVLLIFHVVRVRAAKTWETYIPPEEEEIP